MALGANESDEQICNYLYIHFVGSYYIGDLTVNDVAFPGAATLSSKHSPSSERLSYHNSFSKTDVDDYGTLGRKKNPHLLLFR